jgi:DNA (cytosine-5)-methyltransferase 1
MEYVDLCCGIGGFRLALDPSKNICVLSCDIDKFACQTYQANFDEYPSGDIRTLTKIPKHDLLMAGFPCQSFSRAWTTKAAKYGLAHGLEAAKGTIFYEIARILSQNKPEYFLLENVKNLIHHDKGQTFDIIMSTLTDLGYHVTYTIIDAASKVPQHRERVFIAGCLSKPLPELPRPLVGDSKIRDILEDEVPDKYTISDIAWSGMQKHKERHKNAGNGFGYGLVDLDGKSRTLLSRYYKNGSEILIPQEGKNPRRLTPRECARLMGFPDTFKIVCSDTQAYKQFGNSVVVPVVKEVLDAILP